MPTTLTPADTRRFARIEDRLNRTGPLEAGAQGPAIQALETLLRDLGFNPGTPDGDFDARLRGTLKNFQAAMGLPETGVLDAASLKSLRTSLTTSRALPGSVHAGLKGDDVARTERQLDRLGYDVGTKDGIADGTLGAAMVAFKRDQSEFDNTAALLSVKGQQVLGTESAGLRHASYRGRSDLTLQQHQFDGVLADLSKRQNADGTVGIGEGAQRPAIGQLQTRLRKAGFDPQRTDGVFDERTRGALEAFQRANGIEVSGRLDPATWNKLSRTIIDTDQAAAPVQRAGEKSRAVLRTEKLLEKAGFATGPVDGLFDRRTAAAVRQFEQRTNRPVNGAVGERDLAGLKELARTPFPEPKSDYSRHSFRGHTANARSIEMINQAERWAKAHGVAPGWALFQGSYNTSVDDSANTHAGGGAFDFNTEGRSPRTVRIMVEALRRAGFAAWHRPAGSVSPEDHIHAIAIGDREMSSEARVQVREYFAGGDGLSGSAPDPHQAIGRPIPEWAKKFR